MDTDKVMGYRTSDGVYIVFVVDSPKIIGRGTTAEKALEDLIEKYKDIITAVHKTIENQRNK